MVCLSVCPCLCLWWVFVHPSVFGNCGSSLLVACCVPSRGRQPGGDAQEAPPSAGPSPQGCRASAPAPPGDPMTGVCLEVKPNSQADWGSGKWNIVRGSGSSLPLAVEPVFCPGIPGGSLERGPSILEAGGESSPHFSFPSVIPVSSLYSVCDCSTGSPGATWRNHFLGALGPYQASLAFLITKTKRRDCEDRTSDPPALTVLFCTTPPPLSPSPPPHQKEDIE